MRQAAAASKRKRTSLFGKGGEINLSYFITLLDQARANGRDGDAGGILHKKPGEGGPQIISGFVPGLAAERLVVVIPSGRERHRGPGLEELRVPHPDGSVGRIVHQIAMRVIPIDLK